MACASYIAVDVETTGLNPKTDKIIEIGAIRIVEGRIVAEKSTLVNPRRRLEPFVRELTGIEDPMLQNAPDIGDIIKEYVAFFQELPLLGHRILFDYGFLKKAAVNGGFRFEKQGIDTLALCRKFMPPEEKKNLTNACNFYGVDTGRAHRAAQDAYGAHMLYQKLLFLYGNADSAAFLPKPLVFKIKKEQPASKRQKEVLRELIKYHKIDVASQIDCLTRSEVSRMTDKIISKYGRIVKR